jgi:hypothetical protein
MMYRLDRADAPLNNPHRPRPTQRLPGNVPYLVDNLWEWSRPPEMPSRRHSVYASPTPELARANGGAAGGQVFQVELRDAQIVQLPCKDARDHPDLKVLSRLLPRLLPAGWADRPAEQKLPEALLWAPCLSAAEVEQIFQRSDFLGEHRATVRAAVTLWSTARLLGNEVPAQWPWPEGEIFFRASAWSLLPLDQD